MPTKNNLMAPSLRVQPDAPVAGLRRRERGAYPHDKFYRSNQWRRFRERVMAERGYQCAWCGYVGAPGDGDVVLDHILPMRTHPHLRLVEDNTRILCRPCDAHRHAQDRPGSRKRISA